MPGSGSIDGHTDIDGLITDPPGNPASSRQPLSITYDNVIKPTRLLLVLKYRYACQLPLAPNPRQPSILMTRFVQSTPEYRLTCHILLLNANEMTNHMRVSAT